MGMVSELLSFHSLFSEANSEIYSRGVWISMQLWLLAGCHEACGRGCCCKTKAMTIVFLPTFHLLRESTLSAPFQFIE